MPKYHDMPVLAMEVQKYLAQISTLSGLFRALCKPAGCPRMTSFGPRRGAERTAKESRESMRPPSMCLSRLCVPQLSTRSSRSQHVRNSKPGASKHISISPGFFLRDRAFIALSRGYIPWDEMSAPPEL